MQITYQPHRPVTPAAVLRTGVSLLHGTGLALRTAWRTMDPERRATIGSALGALAALLLVAVLGAMSLGTHTSAAIAGAATQPATASVDTAADGLVIDPHAPALPASTD